MVIVAMMTISSKEAQNGFGALLDKAQRTPVVIQRHKRDCAVVMSADEYERYRQSRVETLLGLANDISAEASANGLTPELLQQIIADEA